MICNTTDAPTLQNIKGALRGGDGFMLKFLPLLLQLTIVVIDNWPSKK